MPSVELPEISDQAPVPSVIEAYEAMSAGPERLAFFQTNRRAIETALSARIGNWELTHQSVSQSTQNP